MVKVLSGLVAAIVIAVGGFFGFQFYTQHRIASEVDAALEQIRAAGGKASHGKMSFDLLSRTVTIADIAAQSAAQPPVSVKIGSLTASGVSQPDAARFSAESIEIADVEISAAIAPQPALSLAYKVPRIIREGLFRPRQPATAAGFVVLCRRLPVRARAVRRRCGDVDHRSQPDRNHQLRRCDAGRRRGRLYGPCDAGHQGRQDRQHEDRRCGFHGQRPSRGGKPDKLTGNLANIAGYDIDTAAVAALFDPQKAGDDQYYRDLPADHDGSLCRHVRARPEHADRRHDDR